MSAARQSHQLLTGGRRVHRLGEDLALQRQHLVRADHQGLGPPPADLLGLRPAERRGDLARLDGGVLREQVRTQRRLVDLGRHNLEHQPRRLQQAPPRDAA